jgi:hypothetical protein
MNMPVCALLALVIGANAQAALVVKIDQPKQTGQKTVVRLKMKNTFTETVDSARAQVFLIDDAGKVVAQAVHWVIGGTKDRPVLARDKETTFNFVVGTDKPFKTAKVAFTRLVLEGGRLADVKQSVEIQE